MNLESISLDPLDSLGAAYGPRLESLMADPDARVWGADTACGRQGDVILRRIDNADPRLDRAAPETERLDQIVARGSRAAHVAVNARAYDLGEDGVLVVASTVWALEHQDTPGERHHPHILPPGAYLCRRQQELTPQGVRRVFD